ncbi:hypothetical protein [Legionella impletisoli]|uniref:Uncharacterized protein n=1 Tax=Legionella impletisoli TaxID=343510 RepID=A0A917JPM8_9GAMM|nr:hypothetical protein [Legionella impletisoli]GGI80519.1 hypothetical protein GCM10007966_06300 [Legionella impletisoli]
MKDPKNVHSCLWAYKYELLGLVLLVIATLLTIFTLNSVGIAAMFLVALVLCGHRCLCNKCCKACHPDVCEDESDKETIKSSVSKAKKI